MVATSHAPRGQGPRGNCPLGLAVTVSHSRRRCFGGNVWGQKPKQNRFKEGQAKGSRGSWKEKRCCSTFAGQEELPRGRKRRRRTRGRAGREADAGGTDTDPRGGVSSSGVTGGRAQQLGAEAESGPRATERGRRHEQQETVTSRVPPSLPWGVQKEHGRAESVGFVSWGPFLTPTPGQ